MDTAHTPALLAPISGWRVRVITRRFFIRIIHLAPSISGAENIYIYIMFAKLFQYEDWQILVTKSYNDEEKRYELTFRTDVDGMSIEVTAKYTSEESVEKEFEAYDAISAFQFRQNILARLQLNAG